MIVFAIVFAMLIIPMFVDSPDMWTEIARQMKFAESTKGKYPNMSSKDAPVLPRYPVPNCCCGKTCHIQQSNYHTTAGRAFYRCPDTRVSFIVL